MNGPHAAAINGGLTEVFAQALRVDDLAPAEQSFVDQIGDDYRAEELAGLDPVGFAAALASFWQVAGHTGDEPRIRLAEVKGAVGLELLEIVQDDAPFLVDSVMAELNAGRFDVRAMFHPVVRLNGRDKSLILVVLGAVGEDRRQALIDGVKGALSDVRAAVNDHKPMLAMIRAEAEALQAAGKGEDVEEAVALLRWLAADHFVFLGARAYSYPRDKTGGYLPEPPVADKGSALGVLSDPSVYVLRADSEPARRVKELEAYLRSGSAVTVAKANIRSRVHRRAYMDYVAVKRYGSNGDPVGEVRFVGLFTAETYHEPVREIPLIRRKAEAVLRYMGGSPSGHSEKRLKDIIDTYPRDELFQIDPQALFENALGLLHLQDRPRVKLITRRDPFDRFISAMLFVPRDRYSADAVDRVGAMLAKAWNGRLSAAYPHFDDGPLARTHFIIGVEPGKSPDPDLAVLEAEITEALRTWQDRFEEAARAGGEMGDLLTRYDGAFPAGYRDLYSAQDALADVAVIEGMPPERAIGVRAYRRVEDGPLRVRFKLYRAEEAIPLADVLPILENMGLKALEEAGFPVRRGGDAPVVWVHDFLLQDEQGERLVFEDVKTPFEETFAAAWTGRTENDGFNRLVLELGVTWREAALIRAFARHRSQTGLDPSQAVQEQVLSDYPGVARLILDLFRIKFDPAIRAGLADRKDRAEAVSAEILTALQTVESLDADRVLRRIANLVGAMQRTNYYQVGADGEPKPYISFKIAPRELDELPLPKPYREVFVSSPDVEGVHLRFGPVARGGLRWSDRRDDFRTEVLGLVKAQQVKNAVIVPVGAKGGFYPKHLPKGGTPEAIRAEGVRAYRMFLSGLLDITDNLDADSAVVRPPAVIAHDGDDPYLVVAADKGTATFSDIANGVAEDYGFWLGDAFASGGSAGYDHKAMGITARGAWEAVKRHFRELGKDIQTEPFVCVGVGDMSGDVFGNGMLLSKATKLVAAFDHRHIFLDPDPDPEVSWTERNRLFALPRSSWADYNTDLISKGGYVFPRSAKEVPLSPEVQALLGVQAETMAPTDLIRAILTAQVELLYLGGIGTYVKAPSESHLEVGDKASDAVRVDATELRCKVVGEGANLGFTQKARIAYARNGGRINTDAIDNSAGVDTSDHEVNIKILTGQLERAGKLKRKARDVLLASMTESVGEHVLAHNYAQTLCLSLQQADAAADLDAHAGFMTLLESDGRLDRKVENLPGRDVLSELRGAGLGLTRPELAVLTAYGKLELSAEIVASAAPDDPYFEKTLIRYFPEPMEKYKAQMQRHRLRREIVATVLANDIVDMTGPTFATRLMGAVGCDAAGFAAAFEAARQTFRMDEAWREVSALDLKVSAECQLALYQAIAIGLRGQVFRLARWVGQGPKTVQSVIDAYRPAADALASQGSSILSAFERDALKAQTERFCEMGAPRRIARNVAFLGAMRAVPEIADLARDAKWTPVAAGRLYHQVGGIFGLDRLRAAAHALAPADSYERTALRRLIIDLFAVQAAITRSVMREKDAAKTADTTEGARKLVGGWTAGRQAVADRAARAMAEIEATKEGWSFAKLTIVAASLRELTA